MSKILWRVEVVLAKLPRTIPLHHESTVADLKRAVEKRENRLRDEKITADIQLKMDDELSTVDPDDILLDLIPENSKGRATFVATLNKGGGSAPSSEEAPVGAAGEAAAAAAAAAVSSSSLPSTAAGQAAQMSPPALSAPTGVAAAAAADPPPAAVPPAAAAAVSGGNGEAGCGGQNESGDEHDDVVFLGCSPAAPPPPSSPATSSAAAAEAAVSSSPLPPTAAGQAAHMPPPSRKKARVTPTTGSSGGGSADTSGGGACTKGKMLSDFEELQEGQHSILKSGVLVSDVMSALKKKKCAWWRTIAQKGIIGHKLANAFSILTCTTHRVHSVVKSPEVLRKQFFQDNVDDCGTTGKYVIAPLMRTLVSAAILVGPDAGGRFRPGEALKRELPFLA